MLRTRVSGRRLRAVSVLIVLGCLTAFTLGRTLAQRGTTGGTPAVVAQAANVLGSAFASQGTAPPSHVSTPPTRKVAYTNLPTAAPPAINHERKGSSAAHRQDGGHHDEQHPGQRHGGGD